MRHIRSIEDILDYAIERETQANIFYKKLAIIVKKPDVRATINKFSLDEYRHKIQLEGIKDGHLTFTYDEIDGLGLADSFNDLNIEIAPVSHDLLLFKIIGVESFPRVLALFKVTHFFSLPCCHCSFKYGF